MFKIVGFLTVVAFSIISGFSQDLKKSERTCRLVFPEKPSDTPRFVYLFDGKESHKVYVSAVNFSDVVKLSPGDISLVISAEEITDPETIDPACPRVSVPKEIRNFYLFLSPDRKNKAIPLRASLVNLDSGKFKLGSTLWYNFTDHRIAAKLGDSKMSVAAKKSTISKEPLSENGYYRAEFIYQPNSEGDFRRITEQQWWFDEDCRYVGFIADHGARLPKIYFFRDFRSRIKEKAQEE